MVPGEERSDGPRGQGDLVAETSEIPNAAQRERAPAAQHDDPRLALTVTQGPSTAKDADGTALLGQRLAHFQIVALLGQGGMGQVYRALDERLQREVALKVIHSGASQQSGWRERLLREARAAAAVSHKHIASVYEVGEEGELAFIAMELIEGKTLRQHLGVALPLDEALRLALQIARGVARAHDKHVLHRDLKPENVMVGVDGDVKILDFGLAKRMGVADEPVPSEAAPEPGATQGGAIMGTPGYMSPEQILGGELDHRSDIFSFGAMLYEMVTGAHPFRGNMRRALVDTLNRTPPPPSRLLSRVPPLLDRLIMRCLARKREERVASMHEVARDLSQITASAHGAITGPSGEATFLPTLRMPEGTPSRPRPLPSGSVTLLVAVVAEAALLVEQFGEAYQDILGCYHALVARATERHRGCVVSAASEQILAVFADPQQAVDAAIDAQRAFHAELWPGGASVRVRVGVHTGEPRLIGDRYSGLDVHRAIRIGESAPGGHVVLSAAARKGVLDGSLDGLLMRDLGSVRIKDLHYPEHLFSLSIDGLPSTRSLVRGRSRNALPAQPTAFIGRTKLIAEVVDLVRREDVRLVTLTGPGGTGKTRLSIEVARALEADFPDGIVQVLLGSVRDPALVLPTIARALDLPEVPGTPPLDVLTNGIGASSLLLLLDNFEQIVDAAPAVAQLLAGCSGLKALVTSRELLRVRGEREYGVPPLELPAAGAGDLDSIAASEAVRMFVERARDVSPSFTLTPESAPLVAAICARLEAVPLAIELAASRMKMLSLEALHRRLDDRLGFLKAAERDREQRHRTLRAAIDWSHDLLDEPQKTLFRRAAVFVGGFSIESAELVCGDEGGEIDVLEGLASLVGKSLFTMSEVDGAPRVGALETIREYALERLKASPDEATVRARHAEHYAALVEEMSTGVLGRDWRRHVGPLLTEAANIRAALDWALAQPSASLTVRMLRALKWFWVSHGRIAEGRAFVDRAITQTRALGPTEERARTLDVACWLELLSGDMAALGAHTAESTEIWRALRREEEGARTKTLLGLAMAVNGAFAEGLAIVEEACAACRAQGDLFGAALALNVRAELERGAGNYEGALASNEASIALMREVGHIVQSSMLAINLAFCHLHQGDWARAAEAVVETLELSLELNNPFNIAYYVAVMACVAVARGKPADGLRLFGAFDSMLRAIGATVQPTDQVELDRYIHAATAALGDEAAAAARTEGAVWTRAHAIAMTLPLRA